MLTVTYNFSVINTTGFPPLRLLLLCHQPIQKLQKEDPERFLLLGSILSVDYTFQEETQ